MELHKKIKYPDGSFYTKVENFKKDFIFKVNDFNDLWQLNQIIDVYTHNNVRPTITIPNLLTAQEDRRFNSNESFGLKLVCKFLNSMDANFKVFHPHNLEVVEALMDNVEIISNSEFIKEVLDSIANPNTFDVNDWRDLKENLILFSSDAGGFKPIMKLADKLNWQGDVYGASKSRKYEDGKSKLIQVIDRQDFEGKDILIIDDICVFGGTFKGLSNMLKERNCGKLFLAVSHMTVQDLGEDPVTNYFDKVYTTNSKFDNYGVKGLKIIELNLER